MHDAVPSAATTGGGSFGQFFANNYLYAVVTARHTAILLLAVLLPLTAGAQSNHVRRAMERTREKQEKMALQKIDSEGGAPAGAGYMQMMVENGDTLYLDKLPPIWVTGRSKRSSEKNWREYYKLVWRFARVYPYAIAAGDIQHLIDSTVAANGYGSVKRTQLISKVQKQLFANYEKDFRNMSIQQGALMIKLIDRETGQSSYSIIKEYKNSAAAGFWQGIAKMFDNDLKARYDPEGADKQIEELVQIWNAGYFPSLYWSVFWEDAPVIKPKKVVIDK